MSLNAAILDQRVRKVAQDHAVAFGSEPTRALSRAFVALAVSAVLDLEIERATTLVTDGADDANIDAIVWQQVGREELLVTIFQAKYHQKAGTKGFPSGELQKLVVTIGKLFDPYVPFDAHEQLLYRVEELRSLIRDGLFPRVRVIACSNGLPWEENGARLITPEATGFPADQVSWEHMGADQLIALLHPSRPVDDEVHFDGATMLEDDFVFRRVIVGRVPVTEVARLIRTHGERMVERNIRRFLGVHNRVNQDIAATLRVPERREDFFFYNNGLTFVCRQFRANRLQHKSPVVKAEGLQLVNGGQTASTIRATVDARPDEDYSRSFVLVRLYEVGDEDRDVITGITFATNSQTPVELRDLRANDEIQKQLEIGLKDLGYVYARKRGEKYPEGAIQPEQLAEASLAVWAKRPDWARFRQQDHFGDLYKHAFPATLAPKRALWVWQLWRFAQEISGDPDLSGLGKMGKLFLYGKHAWVLALHQELVDGKGLQPDQDNDFHRIFTEGESRFRAILRLELALHLTGIPWSTCSLQSLSGAFRRMDFVRTIAELQTSVHLMVQEYERHIHSGPMEPKEIQPNMLAALVEASVIFPSVAARAEAVFVGIKGPTARDAFRELTTKLARDLTTLEP
jgi:hypothetical protein